MAMELDEIDGYEDFDYEMENEAEFENGQQPNDDYQEESYDDQEDSYEESILETYLRGRGINPEAVKFQNDEGEIEEVPFDSLSREEQLEILHYNELDDNYGLDDQETQFINTLRANRMSVQDYINYVADTSVKNYLSQNNQQTDNYSVDYIPDDELFLLDLKASIPDISDEDAISELDAAKANPNLYEKKISSIRQEYQEKENMLLEQEQQEQAYAAQQQAQQFEAAIIDAVNNNEFIDFGSSSLALTVDDKEEIASFILDTDGAGVRHIAKTLNDPNELVKMVWYKLKGEEAFNQISEYYKQEIAKASRTNYTKGYEDAKAGRSANSSKTVVRKPASYTNKKKPLSIDELD